MSKTVTFNGVNGWRESLQDYHLHEKVAVTFLNEKCFRIALDRISTHDKLSGVPRELRGDRTFILPREALEHLKDLDYEEHKVTKMDAPLIRGRIFHTEC